MFLARSRPIYRISHLYYDVESQKMLQQYKSAPSGPYNLPIKFIPAKQKPTRWNKFFLDRKLASYFETMMGFIDECGTNLSKQNKERFPEIEETLRVKIESFIKSRPQEIIVHQCDVGRAYFLEQRRIYGVFFHRKLNLARACYSTEFDEKSRDLKYRLRSKMNRSQDLTEHQKAKYIFQTEGYSQIYRDTYEGFQKSEYITRMLIKFVADVKVEIKVPQIEESIRLGYQGPTQHILQIESYKAPYQEEEFAITDVDFFMQGNSPFPKERY